jgi:xanthine dehydrogenase accessory factor
MSVDLATLRAAIAAHGPVARVVVAAVDGSTPREAGAAMLVWADGQSGTIGGGALEFAAADRARKALAEGRDRLDREPLGPALGQCCGGAVTLLTEVWTEARLDAQTATSSPVRCRAARRPYRSPSRAFSLPREIGANAPAPS